MVWRYLSRQICVLALQMMSLSILRINLSQVSRSVEREQQHSFLSALLLGKLPAALDPSTTAPTHKGRIYSGVRDKIAEASFKKCAFKTTIDTAKKTWCGDKRVGDGLVFERAQVVIHLDSDNRYSRSPLPPDSLGLDGSRVRCYFIANSVVDFR